MRLRYLKAHRRARGGIHSQSECRNLSGAYPLEGSKMSLSNESCQKPSNVAVPEVSLRLVPTGKVEEDSDPLGGQSTGNLTRIGPSLKDDAAAAVSTVPLLNWKWRRILWEDRYRH